MRQSYDDFTQLSFLQRMADPDIIAAWVLLSQDKTLEVDPDIAIPSDEAYSQYLSALMDDLNARLIYEDSVTQLKALIDCLEDDSKAQVIETDKEKFLIAGSLFLGLRETAGDFTHNTDSHFYNYTIKDVTPEPMFRTIRKATHSP